MRSWRGTMDDAGLAGPAVRADYTAAARRVVRREQAPYLALRLLTEPALVPYLTAGLAFMNLVDDTAESGSAEALKDLTERTREVLDSGRSADPVLRAYAHAVAERGLPAEWVERFLAGAASAEAAFTGFAGEADFQAYLDDYGFPGIVVFTGVQYRGGPDAEQAAAWRRFVDAAQRVDFLADLAGDLAEGRLCLPADRVAAHGLDRAALARGADGPAVRALLADECARARTALAASADVVDLAVPGLRRVGRAMRELMAHQLAAVEQAGPGALRRDVGYGVVAPLRILLRARRTS
ncbi:squalene/phytoene synthase family protein [Streptomyces sp. NPDC086023]|uniref:squalene/phytoene synthase family protein n=1 Tax=Streptomyces sp. NPDC086023 TaxID=3365746 RepID=UPI0037D304ED